MTYFLAIETSCDETAAAVFTEDLQIHANVVASQTELHARWGGVVPEIAARAHLQRLLPIIDQALTEAKITKKDIACIAVQNTPGLVGALLVGVSAAKMLALALDIPLIAVNHIASHIYACRMSAGRDIFPCIGFVISGGHTSLFHCHDALNHELIGATRDDAVGEAFDKVAAILELGFPGGPAVEREAERGNPGTYQFPRSMLAGDNLDFSFSGLKTAVLYEVRGQNLAGSRQTLTPERRADIAASFQQAVVDVLVEKCRRALRQEGLPRLAVGGGVIANRVVRSAFEKMAKKEGVELFIPPLNLCTDNAAMAALAVEKWRRRLWAPADLDVYPVYQPTTDG